MPSIVPLIPIDLDRRRHLRLDNRALFQSEMELSRLWNRRINVLSVIMDGANLTLNDLAVLLWQGLIYEDPTLTLAQVQDLMDFGKIPAIVDAIIQAWNAATEPAEPVATGGSQTDGPLPSTGDSSGPTAEANWDLAMASSGGPH
jgi:hypothetical protein